MRAESGGEKLSSLEIEFAILNLPQVQECAVVGVPDEAWGAVPGAVLVLKDADATMELAELKELLRPHVRRAHPDRLTFSSRPTSCHKRSTSLESCLATSWARS